MLTMYPAVSWGPARTRPRVILSLAPPMVARDRLVSQQLALCVCPSACLSLRDRDHRVELVFTVVKLCIDAGLLATFWDQPKPLLDLLLLRCSWHSKWKATFE